jgi:ATP synthase mitochondrial F1 complex assembly factor 1
MASLRVPALRHLASRPLRIRAPITQRRWAQVHDVRYLTTNPAQPVFEKYRAKLDQKAKQEGHQTIEDLKVAYDNKIKEQRQKDAVELPYIPQAPKTPVSQPNRGPLPSTPKPQPTSPREPGSAEKPAVKSLGEILSLDRARELPEKDLTDAWRLMHSSSPQSLCAAVPAATYRAMADLARRTPQFILPVPHPDQGAEIHFLQWHFDAPSKTSTVLFTQLAEYKARGEYSQPHTTITHYLDLMEDRGLVLMHGQVMDGRGVQPDAARWLVMCLQRFYGGWEANGEMDAPSQERAAARRQLMEWFAQGDPQFTVEKLLDEAERMD